MTDTMLTNMKVLRDCWSRTVKDMVWGQWVVLDTGLAAAHTVLTAASAPAASPGGGTAAETERLVALARERMRRGLAPPPDIYKAPYRDRIDWSLFPDWARPNDPELYEGCSHEG
jgi:hypothetical protein